MVDRDYFAMPERGWTGPAVSGTHVYPRGWTPRKVLGLDEDGHVRFAYVGSTSADLWTGVATTFQINGSDEAPHTCTVFRLLPERNRKRP
jgi:hypothetical protein